MKLGELITNEASKHRITEAVAQESIAFVRTAAKRLRPGEIAEYVIRTFGSKRGNPYGDEANVRTLLTALDAVK